jgi:hypothetical protein
MVKDMERIFGNGKKGKRKIEKAGKRERRKIW